MDSAILLGEAGAATKSDRVTLCIRLNSEWESEGCDRAHMDLSQGSDALVEAIAAVNLNITVVNQSEILITMPYVDNVPAIIHMWHGGNETGNVIANILFSLMNPDGKMQYARLPYAYWR